MSQLDGISPHASEKEATISGKMPPTPPPPDSRPSNQEYKPPTPGGSFDNVKQRNIESTPEDADTSALLDEQLADLYENKKNLDPGSFNLKVKEVEAEKIFEKAKQSKKPQEISAEHLRILTDKVIGVNRRSENRLRNLNELGEHLFVPEKKQAIKSETIKALMEKVTKNDGALEVISPEQYDNLIQDISATTENPDDFINNIGKLDELVHVVDLEEADKTDVEKRVAKQTEDIILQSMMQKEKLKVTKEQAEAVKRKWYAKHGETDLQRYNDRVMDLYRYTDVEGAPKPPSLPKAETSEINVAEDSDIIELDSEDLVNITEKEAREMSKSNSKIEENKQAEDSDNIELSGDDLEEITDEEAHKITRGKKGWQPDPTKGKRWKTKEKTRQVREKAKQMADLAEEDYRQEGLKMAKEYAKIFTLEELEDKIKAGGIVEYKANLGPDGKKVKRDTVVSLKNAIDFRKTNLKEKAWDEIVSDIDAKKEEIGFDENAFRVSEREFLDNRESFKESYGTHPDDIGPFTRVRLEKGVVFGKKERQMSTDLKKYQTARKDYLEKIGKIVGIIDLKDSEKHRAYKELLTAGVNM